jgi:hypothetical protein
MEGRIDASVFLSLFHILNNGPSQTLLVPPLLALIIYLIMVHIILPVYRYLSPARNSSTSRFPSFLPASLRNRLPRFQIEDLIRFPRRRSLSGEESLLGDEELEEGLVDSADDGGRGGEECERRLSRELEVGFRDESDEEDDEDRRGRR